MPAGRPPLFESAEEVQLKIDDYFEYIKGEFTDVKIKVGKEVKEKRIWTRHAENPAISSLALFLGFESRQSLYDYEKNEEFSYTIKRARLRVESSYEQMLLTSASTGAIFALKNFGWSDKQEIDHTTKGDKIDTSITVNIVNPIEE